MKSLSQGFDSLMSSFEGLAQTGRSVRVDPKLAAISGVGVTALVTALAIAPARVRNTALGASLIAAGIGGAWKSGLFTRVDDLMYGRIPQKKVNVTLLVGSALAVTGGVAMIVAANTGGYSDNSGSFDQQLPSGPAQTPAVPQNNTTLNTNNTVNTASTNTTLIANTTVGTNSTVNTTIPSNSDVTVEVPVNESVCPIPTATPTPGPAPSPNPVNPPAPPSISGPTPVVRPEPTPVPTVTPEPVAVPTPVVGPEPIRVPTVIPAPVSVPTPTPVVGPEPTPGPTPTPANPPVATPEPAPAPVSVPTPTPVVGPVPTPVPTPTPANPPVVTPAPAATPVPTSPSSPQALALAPAKPLKAPEPVHRVIDGKLNISPELTERIGKIARTSTTAGWDLQERLTRKLSATEWHQINLANAVNSEIKACNEHFASQNAKCDLDLTCRQWTCVASVATPDNVAFAKLNLPTRDNVAEGKATSEHFPLTPDKSEWEEDQKMYGLPKVAKKWVFKPVNNLFRSVFPAKPDTCPVPEIKIDRHPFPNQSFADYKSDIDPQPKIVAPDEARLAEEMTACRDFYLRDCKATQVGTDGANRLMAIHAPGKLDLPFTAARLDERSPQCLVRPTELHEKAGEKSAGISSSWEATAKFYEKALGERISRHNYVTGNERRHYLQMNSYGLKADDDPIAYENQIKTCDVGYTEKLPKARMRDHYWGISVDDETRQHLGTILDSKRNTSPVRVNPFKPVCTSDAPRDLQPEEIEEGINQLPPREQYEVRLMKAVNDVVDECSKWYLGYDKCSVDTKRLGDKLILAVKPPHSVDDQAPYAEFVGPIEQTNEDGTPVPFDPASASLKPSSKQWYMTRVWKLAKQIFTPRPNYYS